MQINIEGVLKSPTGILLTNATIRITTIVSSESLFGTYSDILTGSDATYSFTLGLGKYKVEIKQKNKFIHESFIEVTEDTPANIALSLLIDEFSFCCNGEGEFHIIQDAVPDSTKYSKGTKWYKGDTGQEFILYGDSITDLVWVETYYIKGSASNE